MAEEKTEGKTISEADFNKLQADYNGAVERARRFEGQLADVEKKLEPFKKHNIDELLAAKEERDLLKEETAKSKGGADLDTFKKELEGKVRGQYQKNIDDLTGELEKYKKENKELSIVDRAMTEIGARFNDDTHPFIKQFIRQSVDKDEQGNFVVKDEKGNLRYGANTPSVPMSLANFADEIATKHPSMAKANVTAGSLKGGTQTPGRSAFVDVQRYMQMSREEQLKIPQAERGKLAMAALSQMKVQSPR